ncbi:hypothetical protein [Nocardia macrotermitis]|uniref:Uncharacterized protein n=1 Tax=Nocardia macrotermitis TaxID=2585198 RepID=A0A7K0DAF2_9NOCA|nr:hypothetical protein [Nocardia macrotermitis]MQY22521.1 hypothetical protein [Nocardia macrotermitis]
MNPRDPRDQHTARYEPGYQPGNYREPGYGRDCGYDAPQQPEYGYQQPEYPNRQPEYRDRQPEYRDRHPEYRERQPEYAEYGDRQEYPDRRPRQRQGPELDPGKFIGGVLAAAVVTALAAWLCAWIIQVIADRVTQSGKFGVWNPMAEDAYWFAVVAFLCAVLAGALWYLLRMGTPTPGLFFTWIVGILTAAAVVIPLVLSSDVWIGISTGIEHLVIGLPILSLIRMVGAKSLIYR